MADYISQFTGGEIDRRLAKVSELEAGKQDKLVSGENIKTVGGQSLLGEGNIPLTDQEAVKFTPQTLTDEQKAQALANIGAASEDEVAALADQKYEGPYATTDDLPAASASTTGAIYLVGPDGNGEYDRYVTKLNGSTYTWGSLGKTSIDLSNYATKEEVTELELKVDDLSTGKYYGYFATSADLPDDATVDGFAYVGSGPTYTIYNLRDGVWASSGVTVNQSPIGNDEDINQNADGKLQFANRVYGVNTTGMGYKILRKDLTFAEQVTDINTIYEIRYPFDLNGEEIVMPSAVILKGNGGNIKNGNLVLDNAIIVGVGIFGEGLNVSGTVLNEKVLLDWFAYNKSQSCTSAMQSAINLSISSGKTLSIGEGVHLLSVSDPSGTGIKHCISATKSVSIEGQGMDKTIIKTVKTDLSDPDFTTPGTDSYGYHYSTDYGTFLQLKAETENAGIVVRNITIDGGNSQTQTTNRNVGHKAFNLSRTSPYNITFIKFQNVVVKNFEGEGIYNAGYEGLNENSDYTIDNCVFNNNGGSSGNVGCTATYTNCVFENASIEHTFGRLAFFGTLIVSGCKFRNRNNALTCDKQGTVTSYESVTGCICKVTDCYFENTFADPSSFNQLIGTTIKECEQIILSNNVFHNVGYRPANSGCAVNIGTYVMNITATNNVFITDKASYNNNTIVPYTPKSHFYKNNISIQLNGTISNNIALCDRLRIDAGQTVASYAYATLGTRIWTIKVSLQNLNPSAVTLSYFNVQGFYTGGSQNVPANTTKVIRNVTGNFGTITIQAPFQNLTVDTPVRVLIDGYLHEYDAPSDMSTARPKLSATDVGFQYFDPTLLKPIWWDGTQWVDATGTAL